MEIDIDWNSYNTKSYQLHRNLFKIKLTGLNVTPEKVQLPFREWTKVNNKVKWMMLGLQREFIIPRGARVIPIEGLVPSSATSSDGTVTTQANTVHLIPQGIKPVEVDKVLFVSYFADQFSTLCDALARGKTVLLMGHNCFYRVENEKVVGLYGVKKDQVEANALKAFALELEAIAKGDQGQNAISTNKDEDSITTDAFEFQDPIPLTTDNFDGSDAVEGEEQQIPLQTLDSVRQQEEGGGGSFVQPSLSHQQQILSEMVRHCVNVELDRRAGEEKSRIANELAMAKTKVHELSIAKRGFNKIISELKTACNTKKGIDLERIQLLDQGNEIDEVYTSDSIKVMYVYHVCIHSEYEYTSYTQIPDLLNTRNDREYVLKHFKLWLPGSLMALKCYSTGCLRGDNEKQSFSLEFTKGYVHGPRRFKFEHEENFKKLRMGFLRRCGIKNEKKD